MVKSLELIVWANHPKTIATIQVQNKMKKKHDKQAKNFMQSPKIYQHDVYRFCSPKDIENFISHACQGPQNLYVDVRPQLILSVVGVFGLII